MQQPTNSTNSIETNSSDKARPSITCSAVVRALKQDPELSGMTISCVHRLPRHKSVFHLEIAADKQGNLTLTGQVPSPELCSYVEARVWLLSGVAGVANRLTVVLSRPECDVAQVAAKVIENDPTLPNDVVRHLDFQAGRCVAIANGDGYTASALARRLWAIPEISQVRMLHSL